MLVIISIVLFTLIGLVYYSCIYRPKKRLKWMKETYEGLGYKVYAYDFLSFSSGFHQQVAKDEEKYGDPLCTVKEIFPEHDIVLFNVMNNVVLGFVHPDLMKEFLSPQKMPLFPKKQEFVRNIQRSLGSGIAFSEGSVWKRKRKIISSVFNFDFLKASIGKIVRICNENIDLMEKESPGSHENQYQFQVLSLWMCVFSNVMIQCFFGNSQVHEKVQGKMMPVFLNELNSNIMQQSISSLGFFLGTNFFKLGIRKFDRQINEGISILKQMAIQKIKCRLRQLEKEEAKEKFTDLIEALVYAKSFETEKSKISKQAGQYDFEELVDQFCTFYTAGVDTTSHFLTMMIYYVAQNPKIEERLRYEVDKLISCDEDITFQNLKELQYIDWIQNETTRLYGPGSGIFFRECKQDTTIYNLPILKDTLIGIYPFGNHYNEQYFKSPKEFRPQRWQSQCSSLHPFALAGFSGGPRTCIGKHLALLESKIALIIFIRRYKSFQLPKKQFKMTQKMLYSPEKMKITLFKN